MKKVKVVLSILMLLFVFSVNINKTEASKGISIYINGEKQWYSNQAVVEHGNTLVPLRGIFETLGANVTWNPRDQSIDATNENASIRLRLNAGTGSVNGQAIKLSIAPKMINGTTLVPLRFISESLGANVDWNPSTKTIKITQSDIVTVEKDLTPTPTPTQKDIEPTPTPITTQKDLIKKSDLPYTHKASNGISLTINSYEASSGGIKFNMTLKNHSTVSNRGIIMNSTWDIYDGKSTLDFIEQDDIFWDIDYLRAGQEVTGDVIYKGLSTTTNTFTLYGALWQYVNAEDFELTFQVE